LETTQELQFRGIPHGVVIPTTEADELIGPKTIVYYQQELKKMLPQSVFERNPTRSLYTFSFLALNITIVSLVLAFELPWPVKFVLGMFLGLFNAGMTFLAHEALHGSVFKSGILQNFLGFLGFGPFLVSPTYWKFWHNYLHHGHTQLLIKDPDAFPTLSVYKRSVFMKRLFNFTPGSQKFVSYFYFFYWFSVQSFLNQSYMRFGNKMWDKMNHKRVTMEFIFMILLGMSYLYFIGVENLFWLAVIPFLVQNYVVISYITTNHNLSPLTKINDPLENSLTVTNHPVWEFLHLNFGYHVEHHIFPRMSCAHTKLVHNLLKTHFSSTYKYMPKSEAIKKLYQTPRIYHNKTELIHPKTLKTYPTL
jgi:fatty acid desaturase